jgi:hypothetical protein
VPRAAAEAIDMLAVEVQGAVDSLEMVVIEPHRRQDVVAQALEVCRREGRSRNNGHEDSFHPEGGHQRREKTSV